MIALWLLLVLTSPAQDAPDIAPPPPADVVSVPEPLPPLSWDSAPRAGVESTLLLVDAQERPVPGATVQVVHRGGLGGERQRAIGITDSRGRVRWTPELPGVAEVRAGDARRPVAIAWSRRPVGTLAALALLVLAGLGFAGYGWTPRSARRRSA